MFEDQVLIWQYNCGRMRVLHRIYAKYKDHLMTLASTLLCDKDMAGDVVHDVFTVFIRSCGTLRLNESLKGYLTMCVANRARDRNKAGRVHRHASLDCVSTVASDSTQPEFAAMLSEESQRLPWALSQLPYEQREVLLLRLYSGLRFKAIAESQGLSINTVQGRYRYGLAKLRSLLGHEVDHETDR